MPVLPAATTTFASIKEWAQPMFDGLLPYGYLAAGLILGVGLIAFLIYIAGIVMHKLRGH